MKKNKRTTIKFIIGAFICYCVFYFSGVNDTPRYDDKIVLDIRNQTNRTISDMFLSVEVPETFNITKDVHYFQEKLNIPDIQSYDRIIIVLNQRAVSLPGMKLKFTYGDYSNTFVDELHKDVGGMYIVNLKDDNSVKLKEVSNHLTQKHLKFYWKHFSDIVQLPYQEKPFEPNDPRGR